MAAFTYLPIVKTTQLHVELYSTVHMVPGYMHLYVFAYICRYTVSAHHQHHLQSIASY